MQDVKLIEVDTLTDVEANPNFIVVNRTDGKRYRGTGNGVTQIYDAENPQPILGTVQAKTTTYTLSEDDFILECNGTFTVSLFPADGMANGKIYIIKNVGSGTVTIDADGADTIDGAGSITLAQWEVARLCVNNGTNGWLTL